VTPVELAAMGFRELRDRGVDLIGGKDRESSARRRSGGGHPVRRPFHERQRHDKMIPNLGNFVQYRSPGKSFAGDFLEF
jgi:hypothetical protein